jgi:pullulanase-type alpha-1,6-glucosidase
MKSSGCRSLFLFSIALGAASACTSGSNPPRIDPQSSSDEDSAGPGETPVAALAVFEGARAHWLAEDLLAVPSDLPGSSFALSYAPEGGMALEGGVLVGGTELALTVDGAGLPEDVRAKFPHLAGYRALRLDEAALGQVPEALKSQLAVTGADDTGALLAVTGVQTPGVLDDLYAYDGELGLGFAGRTPSFRLWAPTARSVALHIHDVTSGEEIASVAMNPGDRGVWSHDAADDSWYGHYYEFEVEVFAPAAGTPSPDVLPGEVVHNLVTDPYSVGLATNSAFSLVVDLDDPATKPPGWDGLEKPELDAPEDVVLYELHIRDFSISDATVPAEHRGKYLAFTHDGKNDADDCEASKGMEHLSELARAGLTHVHLLPAFDIATIEEDPSHQVNLDSSFDLACERNPSIPAELCQANQGQSVRQVLDRILAEQGGDTEEIQTIVGYIRDLDGFNWGYDPFHYTTPEGSYATSAEGVTRIVEFRAMVQALAQNRLRTVMDVVYNHTNASGQAEKSVLDRIVPGYYHRRNAITGDVERSTCCENTATEHAMMQKLMSDSLVTWATQYKMDGFRFDLMGHHMKANLESVRARLSALNVAEHGVDGEKIYIYGEGWDFGEVGGGQRGTNATQLNMAGTGIGTFSDRLRDAVRGGGPFDSTESLRRNQGFINGLFYDPNELNSGSDAEKASLLHQSDLIRVGMAGNLRDFVLTNAEGTDVAGSSVSYNGSPGGYTEDPQEVITYISAHDNQTLFDNNQYKIPTGSSMATRVRVQNVGLGIVLLGQGVPFLHAGVDMLRSKSMERDSYNSGDWYNKLDFGHHDNNWNVGLPRADNDGGNYGVIRPIIADPSIAPAKQDIRATVKHVREMLRIRKSSRLFRLEEGGQVATRVDFHNAGPDQIPGLIVMSITDGVCAGDDLDPALDGVVVLVNGSDEDQTFSLAGTALEGETGFTLHPVQQHSADPEICQSHFDGSAFFVPARSVVVFEQAQAGAQGDGLACNDKVPEAPTPEPGEFTVPVFLRGEMNDWGTANLLERTTDFTYNTTIALAAGTYQLKVASEDWSTYDFGKNGAVVAPGDSVILERPAGNITLNVAADGNYLFTVSTAENILAPVLTIAAAP